LQKEILESLEDIGSGPIGRGHFVLKEEKENNDEKNKEEEEKKNNDEKNKEEEEALSKTRESHLVVAALIATVTFAAAFTLPGGYKSDRGTAILAKKPAFIVFVIADAMSMVLSILAVYIHFWISLIHGLGMVKRKYIGEATIRKLFAFATLVTIIGMCSMIIAFVTGTYAVLEPSLGLAISTCLIGLSFFFFMYLVRWLISKGFKDKI
jgi:cation transport ATPase